MADRSYTNPEGIGRFSSSENGEYYAPYKAAGPIKFFAVFIAAALETAAILIGLWFIDDNKTEVTDQNADVFVPIATVVVLVVVTIVLIVILALVLARISRGLKCKYSALEDRFIATVGGDEYVLYYNQVHSIVFKQKISFGKIRGYDVHIIHAAEEMHFGISFHGNYQTEKSTPFFIVKERVEQIENRRADEAALYAQRRVGADKPISQNEVEIAKLRKNPPPIFPGMPAKQEEKKPAETAQMEGVAPRANRKLKTGDTQQKGGNVSQMDSLAPKKHEPKPEKQPGPLDIFIESDENNAKNAEKGGKSEGMQEIAPRSRTLPEYVPAGEKANKDE